MIPHNPALFAVLTVLLAVVPVLQAADPSIALPSWALLLVAIVNVVCATLLKMMRTQPQSNVGDLLASIDGLTPEERADLIKIVELRAAFREMPPHG